VQTLIVTLIVAGCSVYATWTLMPAAARRSVATQLLKLPLPRALVARMQRAAAARSGGGCDGCDHAPAKSRAPAPKPQVVTFHPRPRR
jgi:hypothetical protein